MDCENVKCEQVILIGGTGRSGTNIVKSILGNNSRVASLPFEYRFIIDPDGIIDFYNSFPVYWSPYAADARLKRLESFLLSLAESDPQVQSRAAKAKAFDPKGLRLSHPPYAGWELNRWIPGYSGYVNQLIEKLTEFSYNAVWPGTPEGVDNNRMRFASPMSKTDLAPAIRQFLGTCFDAICEAQTRPVFVEDNTHNILFASDLLGLIPSARLIHVVRDPRDVVASLLDQRWAPTDIPQAIRWYVEVMQTWERQFQMCDQKRVIVVRLEEIVHEPKLTLSKLSDFCGLALENDMLAVDLSRHNIGRFRQILNLKEMDLNPLFAQYVRDYGN